MTRTSAQELINDVLDPGSYQSWDTPPEYHDISEDYRASLARAREKTGVDESVITGEGTINGQAVAVVLSEFGFLGGSIGAATARRIIDAIHKATDQRLPLLISPSSGGTRMQEGTPAFALMVSITTAVYRHKDAHLPFMVYLRNPTTGGVMASWGSAGHITYAEPDALLGFLGPRVVELTTGRKIESHIQSGEHLAAHGVIDGVIPPEQLAASVSKLMRVLQTASPSAETPPLAPAPKAQAPSAWEAITATRQTDRPGLNDLLSALGEDNVIELSGSGDGRTSHAIRIVLARMFDQPVVIVGQDRHQQPPIAEEEMGNAALRVARRGIQLAHELQIPLISVVDTPGAELSAEAETGGMAGSIARTLSELVSVDVPTVSVILGQGCGGGALAMLPADIVLAAENGWLSPLPPEGASAIIYRDTEHAPQMMEEQGVQAAQLLAAGVIDRIVPEDGGLIDATLVHIQRALWDLRTAPQRVGREQRMRHYEQLADRLS
ncbi:carboxyl transferase domain-containing protein [Corynebacterium pelargi]|uniref:Acetyl-coenzyme A carboxylase carboxyl transferase subunit beta n=1 Tax=Corynebacterium pelargi TaxID=1471400 RepID=A0A410WA50_9CORY|nr:carboxyl transferase domain-containing protein [Corynebacterium pelargi]QAU52825.1 Acetyl-coenzyme A carboxylase carboxyl transferase subunit beta [Corynebacterium pelargi]GGG79022.1 acetyl-CoA carboxylase beta subunit [Corynebacterium pelargi]